MAIVLLRVRYSAKQRDFWIGCCLCARRSKLQDALGRALRARGATRVCFGFLLIATSSRKAVPEVTRTFTGPLH